MKGELAGAAVIGLSLVLGGKLHDKPAEPVIDLSTSPIVDVSSGLEWHRSYGKPVAVEGTNQLVVQENPVIHHESYVSYDGISVSQLNGAHYDTSQDIIIFREPNITIQFVDDDYRPFLLAPNELEGVASIDVAGMPYALDLYNGLSTSSQTHTWPN